LAKPQIAQTHLAHDREGAMQMRLVGEELPGRVDRHSEHVGDGLILVFDLERLGIAPRLYRYGDWAEWSTVTLGGWAAIAPFLLGFGSVPAPMWTHVLIGLSVVTIASMQLVASRKTQMPSSTEPTAAE
jgi:hypothetical protein